MSRYIVIRSLTRKHGYTVQSPCPMIVATGPENTIGQFRLKSDAQRQADALNATLPHKGLTLYDPEGRLSA